MPAAELNADALADTTPDAAAAEETTGEDVIDTGEDEELTLVDEAGQVIVRSHRELLDDSARQTLTIEEIEELKKKGTAAGKELIAKLLLSHTAIEKKTVYSLAKYKLLKTKKYIRRFTVLPLDVPLMGHWMLTDKDAIKIMEMRQESMALVGCWSDAHFSSPPLEDAAGPHHGRWLVVDDTGGLLTASLADRMGILHDDNETDEHTTSDDTDMADINTNGEGHTKEESDVADKQREDAVASKRTKKRPRDDLEVPYSPNNNITILHHNMQPNLFILKYFGFDSAEVDPSPPYHPLYSNTLSLSWFQLLHPEEDAIYSDRPAEVEPEVLSTWKTNQRGNYHRKRRRWARTKHIIDKTREGGFSGLAVASTMDPISILRHTLPLLAGGAPIAIYSPTIEPLSQLADCFSVSRRASWVSDPPVEAEGKTMEDLEKWEGNDDFPLNPTLLLGAAIQTSRARRWQVLPKRTHPLMTERGGAEGYVFTGWRAHPLEGRIEARGKFKKKKT